MMNAAERERALVEMRAASKQFYATAVQIGNHPFIEFTGLLNEYIKACEAAHAQEIDFSERNTHSGNHLPLRDFEIDYINEKLGCVFTGRSVMNPLAVEQPARATADNHAPAK